MNGTQAEAIALLDGIRAGAASVPNSEIAVCPPFILIPLVQAHLAGSEIAWGGQNLDTHASGAYTGEISGVMLKDFGCRYCIVGHSERRSLYGETNEIVAEKFEVAQGCQLTPILCVGETLTDRESDATEAVIGAQLDAVVERNGIAAFQGAVVAYEPVWAIGTGRTATPEQAQEVHVFIRNRLAAHDPTVALGLRILYGGSVKGDNAMGLFEKPDIDGGLIGGASLKADEFLAICKAA